MLMQYDDAAIIKDFLCKPLIKTIQYFEVEIKLYYKYPTFRNTIIYR